MNNYWTITVNGIEKALADWVVMSAIREVQNLSKDTFNLTVQYPADAADPWLYGTKIIVRRARQASNPPNASGLPAAGAGGFSGGVVFFVGYVLQSKQRASPEEEQWDYQVAGPWEFFMERTQMQQLFFTYSAAYGANVAAYRTQFVLGLSLNTLTGTADTVPGTTATNLLSIRQTVQQIVQYCIDQSGTGYGNVAQFQFQGELASTGGQNTSFTLNANPIAELVAAKAQLLIPDFIPGYEISGANTSTTNNALTLQSMLRAPLETVNDMTCAECVKYELKWLTGYAGSVLAWFDYTTTDGGGNPLPTLHIATRDILPDVSTLNVPFPAATGSGWLTGPGGGQFQMATGDIKARYDLLPLCVAIRFRIISTINGQTQESIISDIAATISGETVEGIGYTGGLCPAATALTEPTNYLSLGTQAALEAAARAPGVKGATVQMDGFQTQSCFIMTIPVSTNDPATDPNALAMWQFIEPSLRTVTGLTLAPGTSVTAIDDIGNPISLAYYRYVLQDNSVPGWLQGYNPYPGQGPLIKQATILGTLAYQESATTEAGTVQTSQQGWKEFHSRATLIQIPGGPYAENEQAEVVPYGLSGYIYNVESILQWEGSLAIVEQQSSASGPAWEISDMIPMGSALNIIGGNPAWAAMNAPVQAITYNIFDGKTTVRFGPAAHLGAKDMVDMNRVNRGVRMLYLIGSNLANQAGSQNTSPTNVTQHAPSFGVQQQQLNIIHTNLADSQSHAP